MNKKTLATEMKLPVMPLPVFLLPNGITRLRIFEPRYLKMIKIASKADGFIISLNLTESQLSNPLWGSWVEIINFDLGKDGLLEIDVKCIALTKLTAIEQDADKLYFAKAMLIKHWSEAHQKTNGCEISASLATAIKQDKLLNELYNGSLTNNIGWVVARWLELLPVNMAVKNKFIFDGDLSDAQRFVETIIFE